MAAIQTIHIAISAFEVLFGLDEMCRLLPPGIIRVGIIGQYWMAEKKNRRIDILYFLFDLP